MVLSEKLGSNIDVLSDDPLHYTFMILLLLMKFVTTLQQRPTYMLNSILSNRVFDRSDQMLTSYEVERKRVKEWYEQQLMYLINASTFNSHILHRKKGEKLNTLKFRKRLVMYLFENKSIDAVVQLQLHGQVEKAMTKIYCNLQKAISQNIYTLLKKGKFHQKICCKKT